MFKGELFCNVCQTIEKKLENLGHSLMENFDRRRHHPLYRPRKDTELPGLEKVENLDGGHSGPDTSGPGRSGPLGSKGLNVVFTGLKVLTLLLFPYISYYIFP